LTMTLPSIL